MSLDNIDYNANIQSISGLSFESVQEVNNEGWKLLDNVETGKGLAIFQQLPNIIKQLHDTKVNEGAYKIIFDKGLGQLQQSANNPGLLRANIVEFGTNNKVKGQAELQLITSTKISEIGTIMLSVYNISSVLTSQYFLSQINSNLSSILENISEIQNFLEVDKRSLAEANTEFLTEVYSNLDYYMDNTIYTQATLINIQSIRIKSLADMKFYYRQINGLKDKMSPKDKKSKVNENKELFKKNYYAYNYALKSYNLSLFIEILMSGQFDEVWLTKHLDKIIEIMVEFTETYDLMLEYFDELKILKTKDEKEYKEMLESFPQKEDIKVELGVFLAELSSEWLLKKQNKKKEKNKQEYVSEMQKYVNEYSNPKDLLAIPLAIEQYSKIHNKRVEIMYHDERVYIKD